VVDLTDRLPATYTLQINVTESDLPVARHVVPHQIRRLGPGAASVLVAVNRNAPAGTDAAFEAFLAALGDLHPAVEIHEVDLGAVKVRAVADTFFAGARYGLTDWKGTPIHAYLEPLLAVTTGYYVHLDADVLLGGDVPPWPAAAMAEVARRSDIAVATPLGGPPTTPPSYQAGATPTTVACGGVAYLMPTHTTRVFLAPSPHHDPLLPLTPRPPSSPAASMRGRLLGNAVATDLLEALYTDAMARAGRRRLDLLGSPDGAWSLHLDHKSAALADALPGIIARVEAGDIPDGQRGHYDLNDSLGPIVPRPARVVRARALARQVANAQLKRWRQSP
jgi:hypothetical protein